MLKKFKVNLDILYKHEVVASLKKNLIFFHGKNQFELGNSFPFSQGINYSQAPLHSRLKLRY
jgi:hypothetical protein